MADQLYGHAARDARLLTEIAAAAFPDIENEENELWGTAIKWNLLALARGKTGQTDVCPEVARAAFDRLASSPHRHLLVDYDVDRP